MPKVLVAGADGPLIGEQLRRCNLPELELQVGLAGAGAPFSGDVILGDPASVSALLDQCQSIRWVQSTWAGVTPLVQHSRRNYVLTGVKGIFGQAMAEFVLGWLLALERRIPDRAQGQRWDQRADGTLLGKTIGLMGTGSIGSHVARVCKGFGLSVRGLNSSGTAAEGVDHCYSAAQRLEFAQGLDYLVGLLPATPATDNLVDGALLERLNSGAIYINAGRANCTVDADLFRALQTGSLRAAVLDVTTQEPLPAGHPMWQLENLYLSSHTAAPTGIEAVVDVFCDNYRRYTRDEPLRHIIDFDRGY
jgi:phosphoglycerate dehydrogenase-like enzyme